MDPTEYHEKVTIRKPQVHPERKTLQAERSHTSMKIPLDLEHSKLEVTSPASSADPPSARTGSCRGERSKWK